jgi:hypothetical protein
VRQFDPCVQDDRAGAQRFDYIEWILLSNRMPERSPSIKWSETLRVSRKTSG